MWFDDGTELGYLVLGTLIENAGTLVKVIHSNKVCLLCPIRFNCAYDLCANQKANFCH